MVNLPSPPSPTPVPPPQGLRTAWPGRSSREQTGKAPFRRGHCPCSSPSWSVAWTHGISALPQLREMPCGGQGPLYALQCRKQGCHTAGSSPTSGRIRKGLGWAEPQLSRGGRWARGLRAITSCLSSRDPAWPAGTRHHRGRFCRGPRSPCSQTSSGGWLGGMCTSPGAGAGLLQGGEEAGPQGVRALPGRACPISLSSPDNSLIVPVRLSNTLLFHTTSRGTLETGPPCGEPGGHLRTDPRPTLKGPPWAAVAPRLAAGRGRRGSELGSLREVRPLRASPSAEQKWTRSPGLRGG